MKKPKSLTYVSNKKEISIDMNTILYVTMNRNVANIHTLGNHIYNVRMTLEQIKERAEDDFIMVHRSILVSVMAIHEIGDKIYLSNGEALDYVVRKKKAIREEFLEKQKKIIGSFVGEDIPKTEEEYRKYYSGFEHMPFAFADIEMVFDEKSMQWTGYSGMAMRHWQSWKSLRLKS